MATEIWIDFPDDSPSQCRLVEAVPQTGDHVSVRVDGEFTASRHVDHVHHYITELGEEIRVRLGEQVESTIVDSGK